MIMELTPEQKAQLAVYRDKWLKVGLDTRQVTRDEAKEVAQAVERLLGKNYPNVVLMDSPLSAWLAVCLLSNTQVWVQVEDQVRAQVWGQVRDQVWEKVRAQVGAQVGDQVGAQVGAQVRAQVRAQVGAQVEDQVEDQVRDQVGAQVGGQVRDQVWGQVREKVKNFIWPYLDGQYFASYFAFYSFCFEVLDIKVPTQKWEDYMATTKAGLIYPLDNGVIVISNKPNAINLVDGKLHCETGPVISYADGFSVYALNGVRVPKEIVMTPADQLDPQIILQEENAEVRREIVRKIGIDRVMDGLDADVIDTWAMTPTNVYELLAFKMPHSDVIAKYLKMQNPSIGVYHIEGVHPDCNTVQEALNWRIGGEDWSKVEQLT